MTIKNIVKRVNTAGLALILGTSTTLSVLIPGIAHAVGPYTCTWTGGGSDTKFSTSGNWSGCNSAAPQPADGDHFIFDNTGLSANQTPNNDLTNLVAGDITFSGTSGKTFTITGNALTVNNGITSTSDAYPILNMPITLGGDQTFSAGTHSPLLIGIYSGSASTLNVNGHTLTLASVTSVNCNLGYRFYDAISGAGTITDNSAGIVAFNADNPSFSGSTNINSGYVYANSANALGVGGTATVASGASLIFGSANDMTVSKNLNLAGTGDNAFYGALNFQNGPTVGSCSGGGSISNIPTLTLSGTVTLSADTTYGGNSNTNVTGTYTANGQTLSVLAGAGGSITTSSGTVSAPVQTVTVDAGDNQAGTYPDVGKNQTYIIDGVRGLTNVESGGILKGSGTVNGLNVHAGGTVAPGHSPGCLNSNGDVTLVGAYQAEIGGTTACTGYDQLNVTGTVTLTDGNTPAVLPTLTASLYNSYKPKAGETYTIINNDGSDAVTGTFTGLAEGATFTVNGYVFKISYVGGSGNDVVLSVVSVPATPNTGLSLIKGNPLAILVATILATASLLVLARRYAKVLV